MVSTSGGSFWADCIPWTQAWSRRRWLPPSGRRKQRGGKSQTETKQNKTKKIMWQLQRLSIRKIKQSKIKKKTKPNNLLKAYFCFRLFTVVNRNPTNPFSWEQYLFTWADWSREGWLKWARMLMCKRAGNQKLCFPNILPFEIQMILHCKQGSDHCSSPCVFEILYVSCPWVNHTYPLLHTYQFFCLIRTDQILPAT